jgi:hypothetical protein
VVVNGQKQWEPVLFSFRKPLYNYTSNLITHNQHTYWKASRGPADRGRFAVLVVVYYQKLAGIMLTYYAQVFLSLAATFTVLRDHVQSLWLELLFRVPGLGEDVIVHTTYLR